ncbi:hypothetical protein WJX72_011600 [[Myrmecia] bisecta]|uniref:PTC1-like winged helix-turn-helix domain-containing protein n=1 Tax=[Myrmecia] bisecta TaxID=41462 RepID=A0AAW1P5I0_9CHLO
MSATSPDKCVLRPALRGEARKAIGDTGLLDHLLKHLSDQTTRELEAEGAAFHEFEEIRRESAGFVRMLATHIQQAAANADSALQRCKQLEERKRAGKQQ